MASEAAAEAEIGRPGVGKPTRPFRFGAQAFNASSARAWREMAQRTEALGYSTFHLADHYLGPGAVHDESHHPVQELAGVPAICFSAADR
jgi:alkanesulfonate monooxygenase SsuD/methylene tetrahydromethanopterin reductase-like flavin-dependent oxidoreductase (luciferase family)